MISTDIEMKRMEFWSKSQEEEEEEDNEWDVWSVHPLKRVFRILLYRGLIN